MTSILGARRDGPPTPFPCPAPADAYARQALALLPPGPALAHDRGSILHDLLAALAEPFGRTHQRFCDLMREATPVTTNEMLPDWERVLGLPDSCAPQPETAAERLDRVLQKLRALGGQSRAYFVKVARDLGFDVFIEEFHPFQVGYGSAGDPVDGIAWRFAWRVGAPETTQRLFHAGEGSAGEPLSVFGNESLQCAIERLKPAHTIAHFAYLALVEGLAPLLWIDTAKSSVTSAGGVVQRVAGIHGTPRELIAQPDAAISLAADGPGGGKVLRLTGETDLAYTIEPPLPDLSGAFALFLLVQGGPADAAAALGPLHASAGLVVSPRQVAVGAGATRVLLSDLDAPIDGWRLVTLTAREEAGDRRLTLRRDGREIATATQPPGALGGPVLILAERAAVVGITAIAPANDRLETIERRIARDWNITLQGD